MARALEIPHVPAFTTMVMSAQTAQFPKHKSDDDAWGSAGNDARFLSKLSPSVGKANEQDRKLLLNMVQKMLVARHCPI